MHKFREPVAPVVEFEGDVVFVKPGPYGRVDPRAGRAERMRQLTAWITDAQRAGAHGTALAKLDDLTRCGLDTRGRDEARRCIELNERERRQYRADVRAWKKVES